LLGRYPKDVQLGILEQLRAALRRDLFNFDLWKGVWYVLSYTLQHNVDLVRRHTRGEFDTDPWGLDWELVDLVHPFFNFLYKTYFRVEITGIDNIPIEGRALLVANHSGQLPWDGMMVGTAVFNEHPAGRLPRGLYAALLPGIPWVSTMLVRLGQTLATVENGTRLLEQDQLVMVFPEGYKGTAKPFKDRYQLARFGRGGFAKMAFNTRAPIIPVSVVGSEETYISLAKLPTFSEITGIPYLPITLRFPWLGLLGIVPLPTKWYIDFGEPIQVDGYGAAGNMVQVSQLTDHVRNRVQEMIHSRLAQRRSIFFG
jgi:1-acyl-sn-glycerol-3-phosphate acyltransferase